MRKFIIVVNGFLHDFSTGLWASAFFAIYWIEKSGNIPESIHLLQKQFYWIGICSIVMIMITGTGRTFTYVDNFYGKNTEGTRRKALIIKHVLLLLIFGIGTFWQYMLVFR